MFELKTFLVCIVLFNAVNALSVSHNVEVYDDDDDLMHPDVEPSIDTVFNANFEEEHKAAHWIKIGKDAVKRHKERFLNTNTAKNVILFLGDGLSIPTLAAARIYQGQLIGVTGEELELSFEKFPIVGLSKTYCVDRQVADSACTSTAYLGGVKANFQTIGVTASVQKLDCEAMMNTSNHVESILKKATDRGRSAGIVTTTRVTHASPAGGYAHVAERKWENDARVTASGKNSTECRDIAHQLIHGDPGSKLKVILGGGRREFHPITTLDEEKKLGLRLDGRDLIEEWKDKRAAAGDKYEYVWTKDQLSNISEDTEYLMGLFEASHCQYHLEGADKPTFTDTVEAAIKILSKDEKGYVLFAEGGRIDQAHHGSKAKLALDETLEFSKAIARAVEMTNPDDTLIVVTADHSHTMSINGYPTRGNPILGEADGSIGQDDIPYPTLSYANGPGYRQDVNGKRVDVTLEDTDSIKFRYPSVVPLITETHGGDDVAVFAMGPWQHLFTGLYEQNVIPHLISYAACLDDDYSACTEN